MKFLMGQVFSSSVSNILGVAMGHPLDTVKVKAVCCIRMIIDEDASFSSQDWYTGMHTSNSESRGCKHQLRGRQLWILFRYVIPFNLQLHSIHDLLIVFWIVQGSAIATCWVRSLQYSVGLFRAISNLFY